MAVFGGKFWAVIFLSDVFGKLAGVVRPEMSQAVGDDRSFDGNTFLSDFVAKSNFFPPSYPRIYP